MFRGFYFKLAFISKEAVLPFFAISFLQAWKLVQQCREPGWGASSHWKLLQAFFGWICFKSDKTPSSGSLCSCINACAGKRKKMAEVWNGRLSLLTVLPAHAILDSLRKWWWFSYVSVIPIYTSPSPPHSPAHPARALSISLANLEKMLVGLGCLVLLDCHWGIGLNLSYPGILLRSLASRRGI